MLQYPDFNPVALSLGPLHIYWYGVMYLVSFVIIGSLGYRRTLRADITITAEQWWDIVFYGALGVILGGRLGYMLFYDWQVLLQAPWTLLMVWQGGMSFHGGLLGVVISLGWFCHRQKLAYFMVTDFIAPMAPIGLAAGRLGNFINGELWGRVTTAPWGMVFPGAGGQPRHPSQLYEFLLEGILLFVILWWYSARPRPRMAVSAMFLIGYAVFRVGVEFFRQPDIQLGFLWDNWLTMGQLLSVPMLLLGVLLLWAAYRRH